MQEACVQKREAQRGGRGGAEGLLVCHGPSCGQEERGGSGAERKDALEDRERGVQHAEEAGVSSGASVQQGLPGDEELLLSDTDRPHGGADHGSVGEAVEPGQTEQEAEASEGAGIIEESAAERK